MSKKGKRSNTTGDYEKLPTGKEGNSHAGIGYVASGLLAIDQVLLEASMFCFVIVVKKQRLTGRKKVFELLAIVIFDMYVSSNKFLILLILFCILSLIFVFVECFRSFKHNQQLLRIWRERVDARARRSLIGKRANMINWKKEGF